MANLISWINIAVVFGSIVLFGAVGETLTEKAGNLNLGTPGIMCMGGAFGFVGAYIYETSVGNPNAFMCILVALGTAFIVSALGGLIYSFLTTTLHANQNVTGLTLTIFGVGLGKFFGTYVIPKGAVSTKADFATKKASQVNGDFDILTYGIKVVFDDNQSVQPVLRAGMTSFVDFGK